jgi:hypothetical protein
MFCPICKAEYRSGFTNCNDCNAELVSELLPDRSKEPHAIINLLYSPVHSDFSTKKIIFFGVGFLLAPAFFGIPGALTYFVAYKYLGTQMQSEPRWLETIELLLACIAGVTCIFMATRIIKLRIWQIILLSIPIFMYGSIKYLIFQDELVSFLGYSCCRDEPSSLINVLAMALNPISPFWQMLAH